MKSDMNTNAKYCVRVHIAFLQTYLKKVYRKDLEGYSRRKSLEDYNSFHTESLSHFGYSGKYLFRSILLLLI